MKSGVRKFGQGRGDCVRGGAGVDWRPGSRLDDLWAVPGVRRCRR